ncbi:hypothetical protein Q6A87_06545 [Aliarcobacter skirrowii]|nr:hypothetical protein [Aliarcobacter skirrowii]MDX4067507.1 hypothetical protein [Aliarcobacter skirrowii]
MKTYKNKTNMKDLIISQKYNTFLVNIVQPIVAEIRNNLKEEVL